MGNQSVRLELFTDKDFDRLISWAAEERDLIQFAGPSFQFPLTTGQLEKHIKDSHVYPFKIIHTPTDTAIGHCEAYLVDAETARLCRILIGLKSFRGKGFGFLATRELTYWCFEHLKVNKINLNVYEFNSAAIKCYENIGFQKTNEKKSTVYKNEEWAAVRMDLDKADFYNLFG